MCIHLHEHLPLQQMSSSPQPLSFTSVLQLSYSSILLHSVGSCVGAVVGSCVGAVVGGSLSLTDVPAKAGTAGKTNERKEKNGVLNIFVCLLARIVILVVPFRSKDQIFKSV